MNSQELNIELIKKYIQGNLNVDDSLFVEKMIAQNEQWKDVYDGLAFAHEQNIDTKHQAELLKKKLKFNEINVEKKAPIISIGNWRKLGIVAASLTGIFIVGYASLFLLRPEMSQPNGVAKKSSSNQGFYTEDEIQIIQPRTIPTPKTQEFKPTIQENFELNEDDNISVDKENASSFNQVDAEESLDELVEVANEVNSTHSLQNTPLQAKQIELVKPKFLEPSHYNHLLSRYGYRQVHYNPTLLNSTRGANGESVQKKRYYFTQNALSDEYVIQLKKQYEADYFARFPFQGIVKIEFIVNGEGQPIDFIAKEAPNQDAVDTVVEFLQTNVNWQKPRNQFDYPTPQTILATVSFGNSIFIHFNFEE